MADEDEIDILGDFQLDNVSNLYDGSPLISQNSDLLNCDYTIHPQWLLDRPSTNPDNWYESDTFTNFAEKASSSSSLEIDTADSHLSTENSITDESGWTEKEKNLLERGIEIFGKSNVRLSQFIGSKSAPEVKYYLKNFYLENHAMQKTECSLEGDVLNDAQIPATIEEVIAAVSTGKPTIHSFSNSSHRKSTSVDLGHDKELMHTSSRPKKKKLYNEYNKKKNIKFRIKSKLKAPFGYNKTIKQKTIEIINAESKENEIKRVEITTGHGLAVPICEGEEIIKIKNTSEDSDTEVEVDIESYTELKPLQKTTSKVINTTTQSNKLITNINTNPIAITESTLEKELKSIEEPKNEVVLDYNNPTELEKVLNSEYFIGNSTKTPERYMKVRNHILQGWHSQKPKYLNKTMSRQGLKNCGDVNCFGKIHYFLEQIGAINYGCEQVIYERPLIDVLKEKQAEKERKKDSKKMCFNKELSQSGSGSRVRNKKKFNNDGEGGYTMSHDENGEIIKHTIINEDPIKKQYIRKPTIRLIYCRPFKDDKLQPFNIKINLSTLLTMDFHAHTCLSEVMGLIGGNWVPQTKTLLISHYEPCLNVASSATHCDMCPISQAKAADTIHDMELDILGWFHSHPTFAPEPSQQDLETQQSVQKWIGQNKPCLGIILSPFSLNGALIASPIRCMIVEKSDEKLVPYKFKVDVVQGDFNVDKLVNNLRKVVMCGYNVSEKNRVDFGKVYFHDTSITFMEKYITSVRMHLAKLGTLDKLTCESIIKGIMLICYRKC